MESLLTSLFVFCLINIRISSRKAQCNIQMIIKSWTLLLLSSTPILELMMSRSALTLSLRNDYGNDNATNQWHDSLKKEKWSCCTCGTHLCTFFEVILPNGNAKFFILEPLVTTQARSSKSLILWLNTKTIRGNQVKGHFAHFVQRPQLGIIAKHLSNRKVLFWNDVFAAATLLSSSIP